MARDNIMKTANQAQFNRLETARLAGKISRRDFIKALGALGITLSAAHSLAESIDAKTAMQHYNSHHLKDSYDYIVCGGGTAGSVIARRLAEDPDCRVLVLEAGGADNHPAIIDPARWPELLGSEYDWQFAAAPASAVNYRRLPLPMGKAMGGGSSTNALVYARGHQADFESWSEALDDPQWGYQHALSVYKRIEAWAGPDDPAYRGKHGLLTSEPISDPLPLARACVEAGRGLGLPVYADQNAAMMEGRGGICHPNTKTRHGQRTNTPTDYLYPILHQANISVLTGASVEQLTFDGTRASGVRFSYRGEPHTVTARDGVVLSMGAVQTPRILLLSGVGDADELSSLGIEVQHALPGVGHNLVDHPLVAGCIWEHRDITPPRGSQTNFYWTTEASLKAPDLVPVQLQIPFASEITATQFEMPASGWTIVPALATVESRGRVQLVSSDAREAPLINANFLSSNNDLRRLRIALELCREMGNAAELREFVKREVMPGPLKGAALDEFIRNAVSTYFHLSGSCRMGYDEQAVVDNKLRVRGLDHLYIADTSVMPQITRTNTMGPAVLIAERLAEILKSSPTETTEKNA